jgi:hypothetical protein
LSFQHIVCPVAGYAGHVGNVVVVVGHGSQPPHCNVVVVVDDDVVVEVARPSPNAEKLSASTLM